MIVRPGSGQEVLNNLMYNTKSKTLGHGQEVQDEVAFKILTVFSPRDIYILAIKLNPAVNIVLY